MLFRDLVTLAGRAAVGNRILSSLRVVERPGNSHVWFDSIAVQPSSTPIAVFSDYCYLSKHTEGEQLLQVREAKRLRVEAVRRLRFVGPGWPLLFRRTWTRLFIAS